MIAPSRVALALCAEVLCGCAPRPVATCVERVCMVLRADTPIAHRGSAHTLRPAGAPGWINIQRFTPVERPPSDPAELAALLARRHAMSPSISVLSHATAVLLGRRVAVNDLSIRTPSARLRRRTWLVADADPHGFVAIDVTAPESEFERALRVLLPIVETARAQ